MMHQIDYSKIDWALLVPMANEEKEFDLFIQELTKTLNYLQSGTVYLVVDTVSKDATADLCKNLALLDRRFNFVWAPENKNVVDAYIRGYKAAFDNNHHFIMEMDAGLSHDPKYLTDFLFFMMQGYDAALGSRFTHGGSIAGPLNRRLLSKGGTLLANLLLGTQLKDMTSGYQCFTNQLVKKILDHQLLSKGHFYQTEIRYLIRKYQCIEVPIRYKAPSPSVSQSSIKNSLSVLTHYFLKRCSFKPTYI
ncbi:MAG: hypothetical protein RIQ89_298 [Bacteroidota bacterium]|jgi:dolichol-phosphate mannosyltransferase